MGSTLKGSGPAKGGPTKGTPTTPTQTVTFTVTLSLLDAQNLLVSLANAINQAAKKGAKKGSKGKGGK
jgi:hypothetical protein